MAEALLVKFEEARARDADVGTQFRVRVDLVALKVAAGQQVVDSRLGDGEKFGHLADFDEDWDRCFFWFVIICNHTIKDFEFYVGGFRD
jgi:hypothetical protein